MEMWPPINWVESGDVEPHARRLLDSDRLDVFGSADAVDPDADLLGVRLGVRKQILEGLVGGVIGDDQNARVLDLRAEPDAVLHL
jgi:hypothetical protein